MCRDHHPHSAGAEDPVDPILLVDDVADLHPDIGEGWRRQFICSATSARPLRLTLVCRHWSIPVFLSQTLTGGKAHNNDLPTRGARSSRLVDEADLARTPPPGGGCRALAGRFTCVNPRVEVQ
jgi:hypothetical protein